MLGSIRKGRHSAALGLVVAALGITLLFTPGLLAQTTAHSATAPRHPVVAAVPTARTPIPPQIARPVAQPRPAWPAYPPRSVTERGVAPHVALLGSSFHAGFRTRFIEPFFFGAPFGGFGIAGSVTQFGGLPLGFGLWPACDSAATPGVFWTVGPCFGLGSYPQLAPSAAPAVSYLPPLVLFSPVPSGPPTAPQRPSAPAPPPTMTLYLANGSTIAAKDWWVAQGRLQYITDSGQTGAVDVLQLDLERTINENHQRALDFRLKFTPPSDMYPPSIRP